MKFLRNARLMVLALFVLLIPASSFAGVFISVNFAPPVLPVYEQPPCPDEGLMWTPGYWAYGPDGYFWVPGAWVPVPYEGALWTPPYWGWDSGLYVFHPGYWGRHVGYYGGVNYGFGYMGIGFVGGMWRGHDFVYNTAVMRVDDRRIRNVYVDRTIVQRNTIDNGRHIAFSGGPGGIHHDPRPEERFADRDQHLQATSFQHTHESSAMSDRGSYFRNNGGRPSTPAIARPVGGGVPNQGGDFRNPGNQGRGDYNAQRPNQGPQQPNRGGQPDQQRQAPQQYDRGQQQQRPNQGPGQFDRRPQPQQPPQQLDRAPQQPRPNPGPPQFDRGSQQQRQTPQQYERGPQMQPQHQQPVPQPQRQQAPPPQPQHPQGQPHEEGQHGGDHHDRPH